MFSEKIHITKKKDISGKVYYTAHLGNQIGGGATRNEAKDELIKNVVCFMDYLEKENFKLEQQLKSANRQIPKFQIFQEVWFLDPEKDLSHGEVLSIHINCNKEIYYTILWGEDYQDIYFEEELFETQIEAENVQKETTHE